MSSIEAINPSTEKSRNTQIFKKLFVCSQFIRAMNSSVRDDEIRPSIADSSEILFREMRMVVKDAQVSNSLVPRNSINLVNRYVLQRSIVDLSEDYVIVEVTVEEVIANIKRKLEFLSRSHAVSRRRNQDLLLKVEIRNCRLLSSDSEPSITVFESMGWRSISIVIDRLVFVLYASDRSPPWLRLNAHRAFATPKV